MPDVVLTYGTFDLFHVGHLRLLQRCRSLGNRLVVGCSTDGFNSVKGKRTVVPYAERVEILQSCRYVDEVFAEDSWEQKPQDIAKHHAGVLAMGDDWAGKFDDLSGLCSVVYLPRTPDVSTTGIKSYIGKIQDDKFASIRQTLQRLGQQIEEARNLRRDP